MNDIINIIIQRADWFIQLLQEHLFISLLSSFLACIIGLIIGIIANEYRKTSKFTLTFVNIIYTIPSISLLGFLIPFSGIGNVTAIIALTTYALLPMVKNTYTGLQNVDPLILEAAKGMGSTKLQILTKIKIPLAMPYIISGIRNMVTMTIALGGIASFIGAGGLGVAIYRGITTNNTALTLAGSILIALLAIIVDGILILIDKYIIKNKRKVKNLLNKTSLIIAVVITLFISSILILNPKKETINIATKPMSEQFIIGEMLKIYIEDHTNLSVKLTHGIGGGTSNIHPAMLKREFDIYPEYTGTGWNVVLKKESLYNETLFNQLKEEYQNKYQLTWTSMYGFNNTFGIVIRKDISDKYNIKKYSDLAKYPDMFTFGAEYDFFEREDGFNDLVKKYNLKFKDSVDLDIGLKYDAINKKQIDVMNIFTTDGQLANSDVVVLVDDKQIYPSYRAGNVISTDIIDKYPELLPLLEKLNDTINDQEMAKMNYLVDIKKQEPQKVAYEYLMNKKLIERK
ncbi:MAG: ABC transporter permease/substrate-binding protein [Erysipelotrichaceae bacterium]